MRPNDGGSEQTFQRTRGINTLFTANISMLSEPPRIYEPVHLGEAVLCGVSLNKLDLAERCRFLRFRGILGDLQEYRRSEVCSKVLLGPVVHLRRGQPNRPMLRTTPVPF